MTDFVLHSWRTARGLVPGLLAAELKGLGHAVVAPDLPIEAVDATWKDYAEAAARAMSDLAAVIVGHSFSRPREFAALLDEIARRCGAT